MNTNIFLKISSKYCLSILMDLVIRERKFHLTLALMVNIKKSHTTNAGEGRGEEHLIFSAGGLQACAVTMELSLEVPKTLELQLPRDPALPVHVLNQDSTGVFAHTCVQLCYSQ